jgi:hypothetical protein
MTKMAAKFTHGVLFYADRLTHDALSWRCQNFIPLKSRSDFIREAITEKLLKDCPQAFQASAELIAGEGNK